MRSVLLLLAWLPIVASAAPPAPLTALVTIQPAGQAGHFHVDYRLSRPVQQLDLFWPAQPVRSASWSIQQPDLKLAGDAIVSTSHHAFDRLDLEVTELADHLDRQNDPVDTFSDGSALVFTGLYNIPGNMQATRFRFIPPAGGAVVFLGRRSARPVDWTPDRAATYVYFGDIAPYQGEGYSAVLDPSLPDWLSIEMRHYLPLMLARYRTLFGVSPKDTPQIFFDYRFRDQPYADYVGTAEPGAIRLEVRGAPWQGPDQDSLLKLVAFFAHETVHLWNGGLYHVAKMNETPWLDEGGADALSFDTLHALGLYDDAAYLQRYSTAYNNCVMELDLNSKTIQDMPSAATPYDCGAALMFLSAAAAHAHDPKVSLGDLWKQAFQAAAQHGGNYGADSYFRVVDALSGSPMAGNELRAMLGMDAATLEQRYPAALQSYGYQIAPGKPSPDSAPWLAARLFGFVMGADCGWHSGFVGHPDYLELHPNAGCHVLNQPYKISGVGGHDLFTDSLAAYAYVDDRCHHHEDIAVNLYQDSRSLGVYCEWRPPTAPSLISITAGAASIGAAR